MITKTEVTESALKLPVEERLELAEVLWESVEKEAYELPLHAWQRRLLDERLESSENDPHGWLSWDEVKRRVFGTAPEHKEVQGQRPLLF